MYVADLGNQCEERFGIKPDLEEGCTECKTFGTGTGKTITLLKQSVFQSL